MKKERVENPLSDRPSNRRIAKASHNINNCVSQDIVCRLTSISFNKRKQNHLTCYVKFLPVDESEWIDKIGPRENVMQAISGEIFNSFPD